MRNYFAFLKERDTNASVSGQLLDKAHVAQCEEKQG